jgi:hypothetical protein
MERIEMESETTTNRIGDDDSRLDEAESAAYGVDNDYGAMEALAEDGDGEDASPDERDPDAPEALEEIVVDGVRHRVPGALKGAFMMQADYTRKTQEVAELRRAVEAERASIHQAGAGEAAARARILALDEQIDRFGNVDWDTWENDDPFEAQKGWRQFQQLQQIRGQAAGQLVQLTRQRSLEEQRETATRIEEGRAVLARDIKGWSDNLAASLLETGVKQYGFDRAEIEEFTDPRMVKVLHDAHQFHLLSGKQKQAQQHAAAQGVRPAARVGGASSPPPGLDDRLSAEEWTRRRNKQVRKGG